MRGSEKLMAVGFCPWLGGLLLSGGHVMSSTFCIPLLNLSLSQFCGPWKWNLVSGKDFTVKTLSHIIDLSLFEPYLSEQNYKWNFWVLRKINIFAWRAFNKWLPVIINIDNRGLGVGSVLCPFCSNTPEDANHLLIRCSRILTIWRKVFTLWKIDFPSNVSLSFLASSVSCYPLNKPSAKQRLFSEDSIYIVVVDINYQVGALRKIFLGTRILMPDVYGIGYPFFLF
ncbi:Endonuclease/exonuclease/phosphatase [Artemisia annua]|uniref:Endonuclease/exonuclease/phosphatase n=1 Tax=Artemisia annua TaxID=35608 RepID=A0A2U1MRE3_ARTAN|nr:Endonuclease/exonuclease/phosphatase [Artemisia annua]